MKMIALVAATLASATPAIAQDRLTTLFSSDLVINGVTRSADGRTFLPV